MSEEKEPLITFDEVLNVVEMTWASVSGQLSMLLFACIVMSSIQHMGKCERNDIQNMPVPVSDYLRFNPEMPPYSYKGKSNPINGILDIFVSPVLSLFGINCGGDPRVDYFYRMTCSPIGNYFSETLITSWCWMREFLFQICYFIRNLYPVEEYIGKIQTLHDKRILLSIMKRMYGFVFIYLSSIIAFIISFIAPIAGTIGLYMGAFTARGGIGKLFSIFTVLLFILPAMIIYYIQVAHNMFVFCYSAYQARTTNYSFNKILKHIIENYKLIIILFVLYPTIKKIDGDIKFPERSITLYIEIGVKVLLLILFIIFCKIFGNYDLGAINL